MTSNRRISRFVLMDFLLTPNSKTRRYLNEQVPDLKPLRNPKLFVAAVWFPSVVFISGSAGDCPLFVIVKSENIITNEVFQIAQFNQILYETQMALSVSRMPITFLKMRSDTIQLELLKMGIPPSI